MKKTTTQTQATTFTMESAKSAFSAIETVVTAGLYEACKEDDPIQFGSTTGKNGNAGFIVQYGDGAFKGWSKRDAILEMWDNSAEGKPNIALRPCKAMRDRLPLATWKKFDCVSNFTNGGKNDFTFRFRAYKSDAELCMILARLINEVVKECRRREKAAKKATTKKATAKKATEKAS